MIDYLCGTKTKVIDIMLFEQHKYYIDDM